MITEVFSQILQLLRHFLQNCAVRIETRDTLQQPRHPNSTESALVTVINVPYMNEQTFYFRVTHVIHMITELLYIIN